MYTFWLVIRSIVLWIVSSVYFLIATPVILVPTLFKDPRALDEPMRDVFRNVLRLVGARFRAHYAPSFQPNRTSLFICNHVNIFDPMVICSAIPQLVRGMELESHFKIPAYGWMATRFGNIPLPKKRGKAEIREIARRIKAMLDTGASVIVFAEGHRTHDGRVSPFKHGIFRMACEFGYPIAPMSIVGSYELKRRDSMLLRPSTIEVYMHEQIETEGLGVEDAEKLRERIYEIVSRPVDAAHDRTDLPDELRSYRTVDSRRDFIRESTNPS